MDAISLLTVPIIVTGVVGLVLVWLLLSYIPLRLWIAAWASGVRISLGSLVGMRLRKVPPRIVVEPQINANWPVCCASAARLSRPRSTATPIATEQILTCNGRPGRFARVRNACMVELLC